MDVLAINISGVSLAFRQEGGKAAMNAKIFEANTGRSHHRFRNHRCGAIEEDIYWDLAIYLIDLADLQVVRHGNFTPSKIIE